ncbi:MAG: pseudoazurin [Limimaricola sp.]|uniref:pseudoazurin n=1 Tax=Limimaricola sp. TaxID=2211665 RepID=UPI001D561589|nr:pseudoazurin [Limimaricola sp.]MBI1416708.1 pseudoazurin [Limimaricola sp.]
MKLPFLISFMALALGATAVKAETYEVRMLNRGEAGLMVFEPATISIAVGDTVHFVAADRGHNVELISGMAPEGAADFKGQIGKDLDVTFTEPGFYGVKCVPHFAMGMVGVIRVGDAAVPADFLSGRIPPKAMQRFEADLATFN